MNSAGKRLPFYGLVVSMFLVLGSFSAMAAMQPSKEPANQRLSFSQRMAGASASEKCVASGSRTVECDKIDLYGGSDRLRLPGEVWTTALVFANEGELDGELYVSGEKCSQGAGACGALDISIMEGSRTLWSGSAEELAESKAVAVGKLKEFQERKISLLLSVGGGAQSSSNFNTQVTQPVSWRLVQAEKIKDKPNDGDDDKGNGKDDDKDGYGIPSGFDNLDTALWLTGTLGLALLVLFAILLRRPRDEEKSDPGPATSGIS